MPFTLYNDNVDRQDEAVVSSDEGDETDREAIEEQEIGYHLSPRSLQQQQNVSKDWLEEGFGEQDGHSEEEEEEEEAETVNGSMGQEDGSGCGKYNDDPEYEEFLRSLDEAIAQRKLMQSQDIEQVEYESVLQEAVEETEAESKERGGTVSTFKDSTKLEDARQRRRLEREVEQVKQEYEQTLKEFQRSEERLLAAKERLEHARSIRQKARDELEDYLSEGADFQSKKDMATLERNVQDAEDHEDDMLAEYENEMQKFRDVEKRLLLLEDSMSWATSVPLERMTMLDNEAERIRAVLRQERMKTLEHKKMRRELKQQQKLMELQKVHMEKLETIVANAKKERIVAAARLRETRARSLASAREEMDRQEQEAERRSRAIRDLMRSTHRIKNELASINDKRQKAQQRRKKKEKELFEKVASEGGNPYEVLRRQKMQAIYNRQRRQRLEEIDRRKQEIEARIARESRELDQKREWMATQREQERLNASMFCPEVQDERLRMYIRERNRAGAELIDPLNKQVKIYPSKIMVAKSNRFGLGLTRWSSTESDEKQDDAGDEWNTLARIKSRFPDVRANERALPKLPLMENLHTQQQPSADIQNASKDDDEFSDEELLDDNNEFMSRPLWKI